MYAAATYVMRKQIDKHEPSSSSYYEQKSTLFSTQSIDTNKSGSLLKQSLMNAAMRTSSLERINPALLDKFSIIFSAWHSPYGVNQ